MNLTLFSYLWTPFSVLTANAADAVIHSSNPWQLSFQDPASPVMAGIINLHHDIMFIVVFITNAEIVGDGSSISYEVKIETDEIPPDKMVNTYLYVWPAKCLHCVFICGDFIFDWYCDK